MAFVKIVKNKAYFMRFQTKFKRRREGKTDYFARRRLVLQDKDKFNTPKYRLVARITSTRVIAQVVFATIQGDRVFASADSTELKKYGLTTGLSNFASAYSTGLLLGRRLLQKVGLDTVYQGNKNVSADFNSEQIGEKRPFKVILDVGLRATTKGSKVFSVMKGMCDAGVNIPHSDTRYPGAGKDGQQNKILRKRIMGGHIDEYMKKLVGAKGEQTPKSTLQFKIWSECLASTGAGSVEKLYQKIHNQIRKNPAFTKKAAKTGPKREHVKKQSKRLNAAQRKENVRKKIEIRMNELKKAAKKAK